MHILRGLLEGADLLYSNLHGPCSKQHLEPCRYLWNESIVINQKKKSQSSSILECLLFLCTVPLDSLESFRAAELSPEVR